MRDPEAVAQLTNLKEGRTWEEVATLLSLRLGEPINRGTVYQVAKGKSDSPIIRRALGLPLRHVSVAPCQCGQVHNKTCKRGRFEARRARSAAPSLLTFIQSTAVPFLQEKQHAKTKTV